MYYLNTSPMMLINSSNNQISRKRPRSAIIEVAPEAKKRRVSITNNNNNNKSTKSVCFSSSTEVIVVATTTTATDSSNSSTWYSHSDYDAFKQNMKRDVFYMAHLCQQRSACKDQQTVEADLDEYCYTGLEKYCCPKADREENRIMKQQRIRAVLELQQLQKYHGAVSDCETIREMAQMFSLKAVQQACQSCQ